ncbi:MAG: BMP family ABC transporter substrate-binding protein [Candidatus Wallbacteria bacterium]|nr:BMP family ABC transporter substrate-binding protein [Candidatus Wallbacteria bacterium]
MNGNGRYPTGAAGPGASGSRGRGLAVVMGLALLAWGAASAAPEKPVRVGLVLSVGGLGDKSFNDGAYEGLKRATRELDILPYDGEPTMVAEDDRYFRRYAVEGFDLVIGVGFLMQSSLEAVAKEFPRIHFAIVDAFVDLPNVASLLFKEHEGSFLVGAAAAMATKTNVIGFVGGMEIPLIHKFRVGYGEGARYLNPRIEVLEKFAGSGPEAFSDPFKGKQLTETMIAQKADVIFHASGSTGNGVIEACKQHGVLAIGVDANQDYMAKGYVLTSMVKRVDVAIFELVKEVKAGRFRAGPHVLGLAENGVCTTDFAYTKQKMPAGFEAKLEAIRQKIIRGEILVTDYTARPAAAK